MRRSLWISFALSVACAAPAGPSADEPSAAAKPDPTRAGAREDGLMPVTSNLYGRFIHGQEAPKIGEQAPRFTLPTRDGGQFDLDDALAQGQPVAVIFYRGFW